MLTGLIAQLVEWLLSKGFIAAEGAISAWLARLKKKKALKENQSALQQAIKGGQDAAIEKAGENSLNNSGGN